MTENYPICPTKALINRRTMHFRRLSNFLTEMHILFNPLHFNINQVLIMISMSSDKSFAGLS